ncbi:hypothetical protein FBEOM_13214 [Fusarium beomiforme]|uniref:SRR1-like domain-containing protein n=1 Tax=Fusarium beomiforme TaxID=44412 RepID=A0A9P5A680_9HYPO|nr:hypothetical protein FBEOM_13214 [Fusarium beomiforme]
MSESNRFPPAAAPNKHESPVLNYGCSVWRRSSQIAANLYNQGCKLWTKNDLQDIEQQIAQSVYRKTFTVRAIDGSIISIENLNFGEQQPIWKPYVKYQEYWQLVKMQPSGPPETYHCSYLVEWSNQSARAFRSIILNPNSVFEENRISWIQSQSCKLLESQLRGHLGAKKVTKIICCGLGDMCRQPPEWMKRHMASSTDEMDLSIVRPSMIQHLIALTMAQVFRTDNGNEVQLLAQDPDYTEETKEILEKNGFSIVGQSGAGGFAEIDDDSVVFSVFVEAPLKQIIADIARPVVVISTEFEVFNDHELSYRPSYIFTPLTPHASRKPWIDADSPRTKQMWQEYHDFHFPIASGDEELMSKLRNVHMYIRKAVKGACLD